MLDYDEDGCELTLTGKAFDIIADFTDAFPITASECQTFIPIYERWKHFISQLGGPRAAYVAGGTQEQAFHRTMVADSAVDAATDQTRRASATDAQQFNDWLIGFAKSVKSGHVPRNDPRVNAEDMHVKAVLAHRRLMITASGYMGLAPATAAVGDGVYVLDGARMPSVLRPVAGSSRALQFQLVGPCFVQGIMDGEIESMERQTESITLV